MHTAGTEQVSFLGIYQSSRDDEGLIGPGGFHLTAAHQHIQSLRWTPFFFSLFFFLVFFYITLHRTPYCTMAGLEFFESEEDTSYTTLHGDSVRRYTWMQACPRIYSIDVSLLLALWVYIHNTLAGPSPTTKRIPYSTRTSPAHLPEKQHSTPEWFGYAVASWVP